MLGALGALKQKFRNAAKNALIAVLGVPSKGPQIRMQGVRQLARAVFDNNPSLAVATLKFAPSSRVT